MELERESKIIIESPVVEGKKGTHKDLLEDLRKDGYARVLIDDKQYDLSEEIQLDKNKKHNINVIIDRLVLKEEIKSRLYESIENACKLSHGKVIIEVLGKEKLLFSENFACPHCDFSIGELEPRLFSFNSPYGACPECKGLGKKLHLDEDLLIPDKTKSIMSGAIASFQSGETLNVLISSFLANIELPNSFFNS